jgi:hypothetical protein
MQEDAEKRHKEVMNMIEALSDTSSDSVSSVWNSLPSQDTSNDCCTDKQGLFGIQHQVGFQLLNHKT